MLTDHQYNRQKMLAAMNSAQRSLQTLAGIFFKYGFNADGYSAVRVRQELIDLQPILDQYIANEDV